MSFRESVIFCRRALRQSCFLQVVLIVAFWLAGEALSRGLGLPVPGSVVGLFILVGLFASRIFSPLNISLGAEWFMAEMLLFFIPAIPAVLGHREFLGWLGLKVLAVVLIGTVIVMIVTALVVDACFHWAAKHQAIQDKRP